jgi:asparagine synthase (glutamine-hydrolysing)
MCGICGQLYSDRQRNVMPQTIERMCRSIAHRGPDDEGRYVKGHVGLGSRRLKVIDLQTGHQPMANEDESVWIVFNGEIYNFRSLREELQKKGHRFRTKSDTESIVHAYEEYGEGCLNKLNGMFGLAVWDLRRQRLLLARDRLGIKPLYYYYDGKQLAFGSELKAILQAPEVERSVDLAALNNFLTFEYIPSPRSIFKKVRKLEPGHYLIWSEGDPVDKPYWQLSVQPRRQQDAPERLRELMRDAVRLRLVSDVPLGAFLSGGVDSSIAVALMAQLTEKPVKTFSIGFKESSYNELDFARTVSQRYATDHHEYVIEADALELTERLIAHFDEPFGDFSIFPTYLVSQIARRDVTVALTGDGGDELFGGYDTYLAQKFDRRYYHWWPKFIKGGIFDPLADMLAPREEKKGLVNIFKRFVQGARLPGDLSHARWMIFLTEAERSRLLAADVGEQLAGRDPYDFLRRHALAAEGADEVNRSGYVDVKSYLTDDILVKVDRMSMAVSLEVRVPFLDHRIVELAFTLPPGQKIRGFHTKYMLKKTMSDLLPEAILHRDKQGFSIPIKNWIRGPLRPMMTDLLAEARLRREGFFNGAYVARLVDEHLRGEENHSHKLWALMVFESWYETYMAKSRPGVGE